MIFSIKGRMSCDSLLFITVIYHKQVMNKISVRGRDNSADYGILSGTDHVNCLFMRFDDDNIFPRVARTQSNIGN